MLPLSHKIAFLTFAAVTLALASFTWSRLVRLIAAGKADTDSRLDHPARRIWYALITTLTQSRTFRKRPTVSFFHSLIFYGFTFYILVNAVDGFEGFFRFKVISTTIAGAAYNLLADLLSALVLLAVVALVVRRFLLPSKKDFEFNERTLLHPELKRNYVRRDSIIVSIFILLHVGSRAIEAGATLALDGGDSFQPFASFLSQMFSPTNAEAWRIFGYWGALGSVLAFLAYFPRTKHIHIFMAPVKYAVSRSASSGVLPLLELESLLDEPLLGAKQLDDLSWPRLLDAYACIQCNRCQDVCPATATGKSLSPSALEINKRMELNSKQAQGILSTATMEKPLLQFALTPEAAWACTTCGACMEVCPVQDEPMLDIIDIRRRQVMMEGEFPNQLQGAFRGMERSNNPWGLNQEKRLDWAEGLNVRTTDENPDPDVLYWVGCAASYDPQAQKTARAFVQLLDRAKVDYAVLGKRECCTGDSARRAGNEFLYRELADKNIKTLNDLKPKLIVATCPHCMNSVGKEYAQIGGDFKVVHHTEYLEGLVKEGKLRTNASGSSVAFHDPCYLGRHNGVYDAPRNLLNVLSNSVIELDRNRENSFCCGAGGAQFWKEEEAGDQRISDNRYKEAQQKLSGEGSGVLAVGCPFCKSMLESTPAKGDNPLLVKDIAELLLEANEGWLSPSITNEKAGTSAAFPDTELVIAAGKELAEQPRSGVDAVQSVVRNPADIPGVLKTDSLLNTTNSQKSQPRHRRLWTPQRRMHSSLQLSSELSSGKGEHHGIDQVPQVVGRKIWRPVRRYEPLLTNTHAPVVISASVMADPIDTDLGKAREAFSSIETERLGSRTTSVDLIEAHVETSTMPVNLIVQEAMSNRANSKRKPWVPKRKQAAPEPPAGDNNRHRS